MMLDKKVVQYTRDGMRKVNLATGETEELTRAKEGKFRREERMRYASETPLEDPRRIPSSAGWQNREKQPDNRDVFPQRDTSLSVQKPETAANYYVERHRLTNPKHRKLGNRTESRLPVHPSRQKATAAAAVEIRKRYAVKARIRRDIQTRQGLSPRRAQGSPEENTPQPSGSSKAAASAGHGIVRDFAGTGAALPGAEGGSVSGSRQKTENPFLPSPVSLLVFGISAAGNLADSTRTGEEENSGTAVLQTIPSETAAAFRQLHKWQRRKTAAAQQAAQKQKIAARAAAKQAARQQAERVAVQSAQKTVQSGTAASAKSAVLSPKSLLVIGIAAALGLVFLLMNSLSGMFSGGTVAATLDDPELEAYVKELDDEFAEDVSDQLDFWLEAEHPCRMEGKLPETNAYALAILVTGDWTVLELDNAARQELRRLHGVMCSWEQDTEIVEVDYGEGPRHEIVHIVRVLTKSPEDILEEAGYSTQEEQERIRSLLELLEEIQDGLGQMGGGIIPSDGEFAWPVPGHTNLTSSWGDGRNHKGIDIADAGINGEPVVAMADGTVTRAIDGYGTGYPGSSDGGGYGNHVYLDHGDGLTSRYGHMSRVVVEAGEKVVKGQIIGYVGSSGDSSGPHLHFEVRVNGVAKDSMLWFD